MTEHYGIQKDEPPFHHYTSIANWNNFPNVLIEDEEVVVTEKIHGTNWRAGLIDDEFFVGSHRKTQAKTKAKDEKNVYWEAALRYNIEQLMRERLPKSRYWVLFGEVFGRVQDLRYGLAQTIDLRLFDISRDGRYLDYDEFEELARKLALPTVPLLYRGPYNPTLLAALAEGNAFQGDHIKEGAVIRPAQERYHNRLHRVILKRINPAYLVRKGGTEYH